MRPRKRGRIVASGSIAVSDRSLRPLSCVTKGPAWQPTPWSTIEVTSFVQGDPMKFTREDAHSLGVGAWLFALIAVVFGFGALWVAADARTTSNDAKEAAALGGGTQVTLTEFAITPNMIDV